MDKRTTFLVMFVVAVLMSGFWLGLNQKKAIETNNDQLILQAVEKELSSISAQTKSSIRQFQYGLRSLLAVIETTGIDNFNYQKHQNYVQSRNYAEEFPGARGFGVIKFVEAAKLDEFLNFASKDRQGEFKLKQLDEPQNPLFIIQYIEPEDNNHRAIGLDIGSEFNRRKAALDSARLAALQLTGPIKLVQVNEKERYGFLLLYPIYNSTDSSSSNTIAGWVYAPLFINEVLDTVTTLNDHLIIEISDKTDVNNEVAFYISEHNINPLTEYQTTQESQFFGRNWAVTITPKNQFIHSLNLENAEVLFWQTISATILTSLLLIFLLIFLHTRLHKLKQRIAFNSVVSNVSDGIVGVDRSFAIQHWNPSADQLFEFENNKAKNKPIADWLTPSINSVELIALLKKVSAGESIKNLEFQYQTKQAGHDKRQLLIHISPLFDKKQFSGATLLFTDVTELNEMHQKLEKNNLVLEKKVEASSSELSTQLKLLTNILNSNSAIIISCDKSGYLLMCNEAAQSLIGIKSTDQLADINIVQIIERHHFPITLAGSELASDFYATLLKVSRAENNVDIECQFKCKKKTTIPVHLVITPMNDKSEQTDGYLFTAIDMSEQKQLKNKASLFGAAVNTSKDYLFWLTLDGDIIDVNPFASEQLASQRSLVGDEHINNVIHFEPNQSWQSISEKIQRNNSFTFEAGLPLAQKTIPVLISGSLFDLEGQQYIFLAAISIVDRLAKEHQINSALNKAILANNAKTTFIANMSHELRTPLNATKGYLQLLELTHLDEIQRNHISESQKAISFLTQSIDEILEATNAEQNNLALECSDFVLDELLNEIGMLLYHMSAGKPVEINFIISPETPFAIYGDRNKLKRILLNIAGNAVKFSHHGEVIIEISASEPKNKAFKLNIVIKDTGIGIEPSKLDKIFESFTQANNESNRAYGGLGIGLTLANKYVNFLGGKIKVTSEVGKGSSFQFELMMNQAKNLDKHILIPQPEKNVNVLLVDDNQTSLTILNNTITQLAWQTSTANNATDALTLFESAINHKEPFDLVLIDWKMPETDGWELATLLRKVNSDSKMPLLIMVTSHSKDMFEHQQQSSPNLFNGFLVKPITRLQLLEAFNDSVVASQQVDKEQNPSNTTKPLLEMRILVVDDNAINLDVARSLLESQGANIVTVNSGQEALFELKNSLLPFDLVLMDIQMPIMDGYETSRRIRDNSKLLALPIIAMTANVLPSDKEKCIAEGMNEHIGKPVDLNDMLDKILTVTGTTHTHKGAVVEATTEIDIKAETIALCDQHNIDLKNAMVRFNNIESIYLKSLTLFIANLKKYIEQFEDSTTSHSDLKMLFHTLKGTAGALGFVELAEHAKNEEQRVISIPPLDFNITDFNDNIDGFKNNLVVINKLVALLDTSNIEINNHPDKSVNFDKTYQQLKDEVNSFNMKAIDTFQAISIQLKSYSPDLANELISALNKLQFKNAKDIMQRIDPLISKSD